MIVPTATLAWQNLQYSGCGARGVQEYSKLYESIDVSLQSSCLGSTYTDVGDIQLTANWSNNSKGLQDFTKTGSHGPWVI